MTCDCDCLWIQSGVSTTLGCIWLQEQSLTLYDIVDKRQLQCVSMLLKQGASIRQTTIQANLLSAYDSR